MSVGLHGVTIHGEDISCLVDTVTLNHGRDDSESQPEAASATINLTATPEEPLPPGVDVGTAVVITTTTATGTWDRFRGKVTDITLSWDEAGDETPDAGLGQIIATGRLADLGRNVVGDEPWPEELDGARVARIMQAAGIPLDPLTSDPGVADLLPRDVDARAALEVAHAAAASAMGVLWHTRGGEVRYADAQHRRGIPVGIVLDSCDLLVTPQWRRTTEGLTNEVSIGYGVAPEDEEGGGGEQPRYVASRPDSISKWGKFAYSSATELADAAAAQRMGEILLARNAEPVWVMGSLPVDIASLDDAQYEALLSLDMHSLVTLTGLPSLGTAPTNATLWVEGWSETLAYGTHDMTLTVTGYCRTTPPTRWDDVTPTTTWGGVTKTEARRNYFANPSLPLGFDHYSTGMNGSAGGTATGSRMPADGSLIVPDASGVNRDLPYFRQTIGNPGDGTFDQVGPRVSNAQDSEGMPVVEGTSVTFSCWVRCSVPDRSARMWYTFHRGDGSRVEGNYWSETVPVGGPEFVALPPVTHVVPVGAVMAMFQVEGGGGALNVGGTTIDVGAVMVTDGPGPFFDGDSAPTEANQHSWSGDRGDSVSVQYDLAASTDPSGISRTLQWDQSACLGPPSDMGRWNDQPATLRWDQLGDTSWDAYVGSG